MKAEQEAQPSADSENSQAAFGEMTKTAITLFEVIQGHRFMYQSIARIYALIP